MTRSSLTNASRLEFLPELSVEEPEVKLSSARRSIDYVYDCSEISASAVASE